MFGVLGRWRNDSGANILLNEPTNEYFGEFFSRARRLFRRVSPIVAFALSAGPARVTPFEISEMLPNDWLRKDGFVPEMPGNDEGDFDGHA
jgi:hypothetical protein